MLLTLRLYKTLAGTVGLNIRPKKKVWDNCCYQAVVQPLTELGFWDFLEEPRSLNTIMEHFGFTDREYTQLFLEALTGVTLLLKNGEQYVLNPKKFIYDGKLKKLVPEPPKLESDIVQQTMYPVVEEYGKSVVGRLSGKLYPFEKDLALANWDFAWSRDLYLMLHELAVSAGNSTKKLQKAKSLLYVRLKSGHGLAYLWLMLPHIQKWAGLDWIEKHVALAKYEFARNVNFLMKKLNITVKESEQKYRYENQSFSKDPNNPEHCPEMIYAHPTDLSMFQDEYFDAVYVDQALHWLGPTFQDLQRAVDELMRVLKPGGVIFGGSLREYGWNSIFNLLVKTRRGAHGIVTGRQFKELFKKHNVEAKQYTPIGVFAMIKPE